MGRVLLPPAIVEIEGDVIFLAGPIQGAADWQTEAITVLQSLDSCLWAASPRREELDQQFLYEAQVDWETHFLRRAAQQGAVMFWLAKEFKHFCERAYAQTSRFELGEWKVRHERDGTLLVVGIEPGFTNETYIRRRLSQDCPAMPICSSLQDTCQKTVELLRRRER